MNTFQKKVTLRVFGIHAVIILSVFLVSFVPKLFAKKEKELITFIDFGPPAESVPTETVQDIPDNTPPPPDPTPVEVPDPVPVKPTPVKPKPIKPDPVPIKPKPVKPKPPKPTYTKPEDIEIGKPVKATQATPTISKNQIRQSFKGITTPTATSGNPSEINAYDSLIHHTFNNAWAKPASSATRPAKVTISLSSSGRVASCRLTQSSGDSQFDATVMSAARSVKVLSRRPPKGYPLNGIVVGFEIVN